MNPDPQGIAELVPATHPGWRALLIFGVGAVLAVLIDGVGRHGLRRLARLTTSALDDALVDALGHLPALSVILAAVWYAVIPLGLPDAARTAIGSLLASGAILAWSAGALRVGRVTLDQMATGPGARGLVQAQTLPIFDILMKILIGSGAIYFLLVAWGIDVSAWVASAGIAGIALGFAAKDTLSNVIAGLSILADASYKIGDYLVLEGGIRGRVTAIGLRSTRLLTRDDIEVVLPNATMAAATIINESGGPYEKERIRCPVQVAYASDPEHVTRVLLRVATEVELLVHDDPALAPRVRFRSFGDSGISVELLGWIRQPETRGQALDQLIRAIHRRFREEGIQIPFPQRELRMLRDEPPER